MPGPDALDQLLRRVAALTSSSAQPLLVAGDRVGRFEIVRLLGEGGFGRVYQARDTDLGRHVALKMVRLSEPDRARFAEEATIAARLNHPNIVTLHDHGVHEAMPYLVLELLEGKTLRRWLDDGPLPAAQVRDLGIQLARALVHAHAAGIVHRDVKPANVFVRDDGLVKLLDFGVSWAKPSPGDASGTPAYMAPEQTRREPHDGRADVFALGVVLHEALAGELPRGVLRLDDAPRDLAVAIERALAWLPDDRATSQQLLDALSPEDAGDVAAPYRWLEPFGEGDAAWFFGRAREVSRLRLLLDARPVVVLTGPSGAGKTSLLRAGLIPRLREEQWDVIALHAGERNIDEIVTRLGVDAAWQAHPGRFGEQLRRRVRGSRMLVMLDQAEQLVRAPARDAFLTALLAAADDIDGPIRVVLAVREDFVFPLAEHPGLRERLGRSLLLLGAPDSSQLHEALVAPARRAGFEVDPDLVEVVIEALRDEAAPLPLLQLAASRLWELRDLDSRTVPRAALERLGGMAGLIAHHADEVMSGMPPADRARARAILLQLITPDGIRRRVDREALVATPAGERVLGLLIEGRLVTGSERVELAHESLITEWSELRAWLDDARAQLALRERVATTAAHWIERGRPRELLWRGRLLDEASALLEQLTGSEREFVQASRASARRRRRAGLAGVAAIIAIAAVASVAAVRASHTAARAREALRVQAILHRAEAADDPAVAALLLTELGEREPPGGAAVAVRVGARPVPLAVLRGHDGPVLGAAISHDRRHVVSCGRDRCRLWRLDGRGPARVLPGGFQVAFTRDDKTIVIASRDALIRTTLDGVAITLPQPRVHGFVLLPDDRVVFGNARGEVRLWDGDRTDVIARHDQGVSALDSFGDGRVVSASYDRKAIIAGGTTAPRELLHDAEVATVRALADGRVVTATTDGKLHLWSVDGASSEVLSERARSEVTPVALRGPRIAYVDITWRVNIVPLRGGRAMVTDRVHHGGVLALAAVNDAPVSIGDDGQTVIWYDDRDHVRYRGHRGQVRTVAVSEDASLMVTGGADTMARVWQIDSAPAQQPLRAHRATIDAVRFSHDGKRLLTVSHDGTARIWSVERGSLLETIDAGIEVHCGEWLRDGRVLLATDAGLRIHHGKTLQTELAVPGGAVRCGDISPDGRLAVAATARGAYLFDVASRQGRRIAEWRPGLGYENVSFSPDGAWLVGAAFLDQVYLWPVASDRSPVQLGTHTPHATRAYFLDRDHVVTGDHGGIRVFDRAGRERARLHASATTSVRPSVDGSLVAISFGAHAAIQRVTGGSAPAVELTGDMVSVNAAELDPTNRRAATGTMSGVVKLWWVTWPDVLARLRASTTTCLTAVQRRELLEEAPAVAERRFAACERAHGR